jgi:hypothetical protein
MSFPLLGRIFTWIGVVSLLFSLVMAVGILPSGFLFGIVPHGALNGAMAFFLGAIAFFHFPGPKLPVPADQPPYEKPL